MLAEMLQNLYIIIGYPGWTVDIFLRKVGKDFFWEFLFGNIDIQTDTLTQTYTGCGYRGAPPASLMRRRSASHLPYEKKKRLPPPS